MRPALTPATKRSIVNDSIGITPYDITNLVKWHSTYFTESITESALVVSAWDDVSKNDVPLTQVTGGNRPSFDPTDQEIDFNGSSSYLDGATPSIVNNWTVPRTYVVHVNVPATPLGWLFEMGASSSTFRDEAIYFDGSNDLYFTSNFTGGVVNLGGDSVSAGRHVIMVTIDGSASNRAAALYLDKTLLDSAAQTFDDGSLTPNKLTVGAGPDGGGYLTPADFTNCSIKDILIFSKVLGKTERELLVDYLLR